MTRDLRTQAGRALKRLALGLVLLVVVLVIVSRLITWGACSWYGSETGRDVRFSPFIGCMVKTGDTWTPRTELRVIQ